MRPWRPCAPSPAIAPRAASFRVALDKTRARILQILQLDRENEQLLLRYAWPVPAAAWPRLRSPARRRRSCRRSTSGIAEASACSWWASVSTTDAWPRFRRAPARK